jgi:stage V sporulation protein AB
MKMTRILLDVISGFVGFCEGLLTGGSVIALVVILEVIPRICQFSGTEKYTWIYDDFTVMGAVWGSLSAYITIEFNFGIIPVMFWGLFSGTFVGIIAVALADVLNVIPVVLKRLSIENYITVFVITMLLGRMLGAIIYYKIPGFGGR